MLALCAGRGAFARGLKRGCVETSTPRVFFTVQEECYVKKIYTDFHWYYSAATVLWRHKLNSTSVPRRVDPSARIFEQTVTNGRLTRQRSTIKADRPYFCHSSTSVLLYVAVVVRLGSASVGLLHVANLFCGTTGTPTATTPAPL